jgi:hypothetical protein
MNPLSIEELIQEKESAIAVKLAEARKTPELAVILSDTAHCNVKAISDLPKLSFPAAVAYFNQADISFQKVNIIEDILKMYLDKELISKTNELA